MINTSETIQPELSTFNISKIINSAVTIAPGSANQEKADIKLSSGDSIADSYIINSYFKNQGRQADVYLANRNGKSYIVKVYHDGWRPSKRMQNYLISTRHSNIAYIVDCGTFKDNFYEIYDYYSEGTLDDVGALPISHIQNVVIPSINEGLYELHKNGIIHCDIKPSNLFYSHDREHIIIGDCGIGGFANADGKFVGPMRGTPEYAPRVKSLMGNATYTPAYDYGSFGLVLYKVVVGKSLFQGKSLKEIADIWESGIIYPSVISGRLKALITGLLEEDEEKRWGYKQVKRWCEGEFKSSESRNIYASAPKKEVLKPLIFGRVDNHVVSVSSLRQLETAISKNWNLATKLVKRRELIDFIQQFNKEIVPKVKELSYILDADEAVFKLLMYISDEQDKKIVFCDHTYENLSDYISALSSGNDEAAKKLLTTGLFIFYLRQKKYDASKTYELERLIKRIDFNEMSAILTICMSFQSQKSFNISGVDIESLEELIPIISNYTTEELNNLIQSENFIAWMSNLKYDKEMRKMMEV